MTTPNYQIKLEGEGYILSQIEYFDYPLNLYQIQDIFEYTTTDAGSVELEFQNDYKMGYAKKIYYNDPPIANASNLCMKLLDPDEVCLNLETKRPSCSSTAYIPHRGSCINFCGNGVIAAYGTGYENEACDDGNVAVGDGCDYRCFVEEGYKCTYTPPGPSY